MQSDQENQPRLAKVYRLHPVIGKHRRRLLPGTDPVLLDERELRMLDNHRKMLWAHYSGAVLGIWLISEALSFHRVSAASTWNEVACGVALLAFAIASMKADRLWAPWGSCLIGVWLLFSPLVFRAPYPGVYFQETLLGALAIAFSVVIPGLPGSLLMTMPGTEIPEGWTFNPSSWVKRAPIVVLGLIGFFLSRYLACYQLGYLPHPWDPFFHLGPERVMTSAVARAWPIPDAGLGAIAYLLEVLVTCMGGQSRWRTAPWLVTVFGFLTLPLAVVSVTLLMSQPIFAGTWCTLCIVSAVCSMCVFPLAIDEFAAMLQFLLRCRESNKPLWSIFWLGGTLGRRSHDQRSPRLNTFSRKTIEAMFWGITVPWSLVGTMALGAWLMALPYVFHVTTPAADPSFALGALTVATSIAATAELIRPVRFLNLLYGIVLIIVPWLIGGLSTGARIAEALTGVALILVTLPIGTVREHYGSWDRYIT